MLKALTSFFTNIKEADNEESCSEDWHVARAVHAAAVARAAVVTATRNDHRPPSILYIFIY